MKKDKLNCLECGASFKDYRNSKKYCSSKCQKTKNKRDYVEARREANDFRADEQLCGYLFCDNRFMPKNRRNKFCSRLCNEKQLRIEKKENAPLVKCKNDKCDKEFRKYHNARKFCSKACCSQFAHSQNYNPRTKQRMPIELLRTYQVSRNLKEYGMLLDQHDRDWGIGATLKLSLMEARNALNGIFTKEEYMEEIRSLAKEHGKTEEMLHSYLGTLRFNKKTFKYQKSWRLAEDHRLPSIYELPLLQMPE